MSDALAVTVVARFRAKGGEEITCECQFDAVEWALLSTFLAYAMDLSKTRLLSQPGGALRFSLASGETGGVQFEASSLPDRDDFRALLMLMRPFLLTEEETFFRRVANIMSRRIVEPNVRAYIDRQKHIFVGARWRTFELSSGGVALNSAESLDMWLNGYQYHRDPDKRATLEALHGDTLPMAFSEAVYAAMILDAARAVIDLSNAIYDLQHNRVMKPLPGDLEEI